MNKEEIKEYLNRVEKLELKLDGKDKETFQWLIYGYDQCAKLLNENEQQNQKYKEVIDKLKNKTKENIENAKCEIMTLTIGDKAYYQYIEKILDNYVDILKEVE